ncbi:MAG: FtsK/SpoIIIE domain-containing protein [Bacteriovoracia bacterium]
MSKSTSSQSRSGSYDRIFDGLTELFLSSIRIAREAFKTKFYRKKENWILYLSVVAFAYLTLIKGQYGYFLDFFCVDVLRPVISFVVHRLGYISLFLLVSLIVGWWFIFFIGLRPYRRFKLLQEGLDHLNLKSGKDSRPKLLSIQDIDSNRTKLLVKSKGIGEGRYQAKLDDLRAAIGQRVESVIYLEEDSTCVEIYLARKLLESKVSFSALADKLKCPYSFIVGKSQSGVITENLEDVPHYMIAGSTNGGKSVALKSLLLGLLESSERLQMYLIDFKRVELNDFLGLPNVIVINEEIQAQQTLKQLEKEMERRYKILEKNGHKSIDPKRDKLNRIVVAIDECTDLTGKVPRSNPLYVTIEKSRNSLDHLARKARACGIHLIFATQKIDSDSMGTRVQENIEGRIALRMNTMENSVRVLQNNMAYHLPAIPGRAIWKKGANYTEIQSPFLSNEEIKERVKALIESQKFKNCSFKNTETSEERGGEQVFNADDFSGAS